MSVTTSRVKAHRIFAKLSRDLARVTNDLPNKILCPLCLASMPEEAIDLEEPMVTEEHIIPRNLGGTVTTLTCKRCNNNHGSALESHLIQMVRSNDSLSGLGGQTVRGWMDVLGDRLPVDMELKPSANGPICLVCRPFNPAVVAKVSSSLRSGSVDSIGITVTTEYVPVRAYLGLFRIAYLEMFRRAGYGYILSPAAGVIRQAIASFNDPPVEICYPLVSELRGISPMPSKPLQVHYIEEGKAYSVLMTLVGDSKRHYVVTMPDARLRPDDVLQVLLNAGATVVARRKVGSSFAPDANADRQRRN